MLSSKMLYNHHASGSHKDHSTETYSSEAAIPPEDDAASSTSAGGDGGSPQPLRDALLTHEAAAIINLHAQAVGVQNIHALVPAVLDMETNNYTRWRHQMLLVLGKFSLRRHVLADAADHTYPDWERMDCVVMTWLLGTVSPDLEEIVRDDHATATARSVWLALEHQFLGNREQRALYLDAAFRHFVQGDLSITDYCRKFKSMADALGDLGEVVTDRTLVLNIICGLNERFASIGMHLQRGRPFPTFLEARTDLLLEELNMAHRSAPSPTALITSGAGGTAGQQPSKPTAPPQQPPSAYPGHGGNSRNSGKGDKRGTRGGGKGKGRQSGTPAPGPAPPAPNQQHPAQAPPGGPWPSFYKPWSGSISMWPGNRPPLAPLPAARPPQPQAFVAGAQGPWAAPPRLLLPHGWHAILGRAGSGFLLQHRVADSASATRLDLRHRRHLAYDL